MESYNYKPTDIHLPEERQPVAATQNNKLLYVVLGFNMILAAMVAFALLRGPAPYVPPGPGPGPDVVITEDVVAIVIDAERNLLTYEAEISEQLGKAVLDGKITTAEQFAAMAKAAQAKAEDKAFLAVNELNNKYINVPKDGEWNKSVIDALQKLKAEGKRKVAK